MDFLKNVKPTALVTLFLFVFFINVQAQEAIATSGIEATSTSGLVSATLGQVCYIQSSSVNGSKSQGVQQAFPVKSSSMLEIDKINLSAFPNPTQNLINLDYPVSKPVSFQIVNVTGKELMNGRLFRSKKIDLSSFSKGVYFIRIQDPNNSVQTIKIIKQ